MEEIDISQLINYFKSKIIYVVFAMSVAFCLASIYVNRFRVPEFTSSTTILLNQANESSAINQTDVSLNKSLISTYSEIIKSKRILNQVIDELNLDASYGALVSKIRVGEVSDTSIIRISVTDVDNKLASDIANSIANIFAREIAIILKIENVSIIDPAEPSNVASNASTIKIISIATLAGAFISVALIFIFYYFDTTVKNEEDIERITGLPVIGIVPVSREKIKYSQHRKYYDDLAKKHKNQEILPIEREVRKIYVPSPKKVEEEKVIETPTPKVKEESNSFGLDKKVTSQLNSLQRDDMLRRESSLGMELSKIKIEALEEPDIAETIIKVNDSKPKTNKKKNNYKYRKNNQKK